MALDTVGPNFSYLEGGVIIPQPNDPRWDDILKKDRAEKQKDTRQRIGVTVPGLYDEPPAPPPRRPTYDDRMTDEDDSDRGYCELDM